MFDFVRDNTRLMLGLLVLLIIPSFVFFGIEGYKGFNGPENQKVASVAGQKVTQAEWDAGHRQQVDNLRRHCGAEPVCYMTGGAGWKMAPSMSTEVELVESLIFDGLLEIASRRLSLS